MSEPVKPKRSYRSARRDEQAAGTRAAIIEAARLVFVRDGWQKATIATIAREAAVSPETVYAGFRNKRTVLEQVIVAAVRGPESGTPLMQQAGPQAVLEGADQRTQLSLFAAYITRILARVAPMIAVLRSGAEMDPALAGQYARLHRGRRENLERVVDALLSNGPLRVDRETAVRSIARLTSPELFMLIIHVESDSPESYADWLSDSLAVKLLP